MDVSAFSKATQTAPSFFASPSTNRAHTVSSKGNHTMAKGTWVLSREIRRPSGEKHLHFYCLKYSIRAFPSS